MCQINTKQKKVQEMGFSSGIIAGLYEYKQKYNYGLNNYQYSYLLQLEKCYENITVFNGK